MFRSADNVPGAVQMFRRFCYDQIGGYVALRYGGEDTLAATMAKTSGWEVDVEPNLKVRHHRLTGSTGHGLLAGRFKAGIRDYSLGAHPLFQCVRVVYRLMESPLVLSAVLRFAGYWWAFFSRAEVEAPSEAVAYLRMTQLERLGLNPRAGWRKTDLRGSDREI